MDELHNLFSIYQMVQFIMETEGFAPSEFLSRNLFPASTEVIAKEIVMDVEKGSRPFAPFVTELSEGTMVRNKGYETTTIEPPNITTYMPTTAADVFSRQPGMVPFMQGMSGLDLAEMRLGKDMDYQMRMHRRTIEVMASQAIIDGKVIVKGVGVNAEINFGRSLSHEYSLLGSDAWNATATSNPMEDIRVWKEQIREDEGLDADMLIMSGDVVQYFINHPKIKDNLTDKDQAKLTGFVELSFEQRQQGVDYIGRILGIDIYSYNNWYQTRVGSTLTNTPFIPSGTVVMCVSGANSQNATHYASVYDLKAAKQGLPNPLDVPMFSKAWENENPSALYVMVKSRPCVVMKRPDSTVKAVVLDLP